MKFSLPIASPVLVLLAAAWISSAGAQTLLARYAFEKDPDLVAADTSGNGLDLVLSGPDIGFTPPGGGVDGRGCGLQSATTARNTFGKARNAETGGVLDGLTAYTITGWYKLDGDPSGRIVSMGTDDRNKLEVYFIGSSILVQGPAGHVRTNHANGPFITALGKWIFFAVTVDTTVADPGANWKNAVNFHLGDSSTPPAPAKGKNATHGTWTPAVLAPGDISNLTLANAFSAGAAPGSNRALSAATLDDIRIYDDVLDAGQIDSIWHAAFTEPGAP